jgi:multidrug resistance efflux pump
MKHISARVAARPTSWGLDLSFDVPWVRIAKLGGALAVLAVGAYAILADQFAIVSDNAVVSAYTISLRSPIDGIVGLKPMKIGDPVTRGAVVATVANDLVDDQHLADLHAHLMDARDELFAVSNEIDSLKVLSAALQARGKRYEAASAARLRGSLTEAGDELVALNYRRDEAKATLGRRSELALRGFASDADLDKAKADFGSASGQAEAQRGHIASLEAQLTAVQNGIVTEQGSTDVAYSEQRGDEIDIRLQELLRQSLFIEADVKETAARLGSEEARIRKLQMATAAAPTAGMIWKVSASPGERVSTGDTIAQIVNCDAAFIIANVPQNRVPDIEVGSGGDFLVSGETAKRSGHVISVTSDETDGDKNLAAIPFEEKGATATVRIRIDDDKGCLVGRRARIVLPSNGPGLITRLKNFLP